MSEDIQNNTPEQVPENVPVTESPVSTLDHQGLPVYDDTPVEKVVEAASEKPAETKVKPVVEDDELKQNVTQVESVKCKEQARRTDTISLPAATISRIIQALAGIPNIDLLADEKTRDWANTVKDSNGYETLDQALTKTLEQIGADFRNSNQINGIGVDIKSPQFRPSEGQTLRGERAIVRMITHLGLGAIQQVPLWNSGIWVTFKPPSDAELVDLSRLINAAKAQLGRKTYGIIFSNLTAHITDLLVDFALAHVYDLSTKADEITIENLKQHISSQDIPSFLWGLVCSMYPDGFRYRRACVADPEKCNHIEEDTINVTKLQWADLSSLTAWQRTHMASRQSKSKTMESIKRYQEELAKAQKVRIGLIDEELAKKRGSQIWVTLRSPSVQNYIDSGHVWIGGLIDEINRIQSQDITEKGKERLLLQHQQATAMRTYAHWVHSLEFDGNLVEDQETIETQLNYLSTDDDIRDKFLTAVRDYIETSSISVIGIPVYECSNCGEEQGLDEVLPRHSNLIPLDVIQTFFGLISQRMAAISER